ncbi:aliphatic sulfonate ABC transporter substrate-binding protein [Neobacillus mesonae]|nr:aliphatic sulfonate ABC transporter substrate-binding protein [Neobacillus mesonae]
MIHTSKYTSTFTILLIGLAILLTACGSEKGASFASSTESASSSSSSDPVKVNIAINGGISPLIIAQEKGWLDEAFKELNAEVEWSKFTSGPPLLEALVSGRVDLSLLGDGAAITGASNQLPFKIVGLTSDGRQLNNILVPYDSSISSIADLKGATIGVAKGTTSHVYLIKVLLANGLTQDDIKQINLQYDDGQAAFESGQLDAWISIDPYVTLNLEKKKAKLLEVDTEIYAPVSLIAHTDFAEKHPELVTLYLKLYKRSLDWQNENIDEAATLYEEYSKIPAPIIKIVLERSANQLSAYTPEALQAQELSSEILLAGEFLKKKPDFTSVIDNSFIEQALP